MRTDAGRMPDRMRVSPDARQDRKKAETGKMSGSEECRTRRTAWRDADRMKQKDAADGPPEGMEFLLEKRNESIYTKFYV